MKKLFLIGLIALCCLTACLCQPSIQDLINQAIFNNKNELLLTSGTYKISQSLRVNNANNLKIKGQQTKLIFDPTVKSHGISIQNSNLIKLENFEIDYDPLPFTQGRVSRIDSVNKFFDVEIHSGYSTDTSRFKENCYIHIHDPVTKRFKQEGDMIYSLRTQSIQGGLRVYLDNIAYNNLQINDLVSIGQPGFICAIDLYHTRNTLIQNVSIYSAPGCGILENGGGGTVIDNLSIRRGSKPLGSNENRLISITRDGLHSNGANGATIIKNSFIEFCGDDAVNIRSAFPSITSIDSNTIKFSIPYTNFEPATNLYVYDQTNLNLKDTVFVNEHRMGTDTAKVARVDNISLGNLIVSPQHTQGSKVLNNTFQDIDARGILATGENIYIEGNKIDRTTMGGIWVGAEFGYYNEGGFTNNVYVRWNTLTESSFGLRGRRSNTGLLGAISLVNLNFPSEQNKYKYRRPNRNVVIEENTVSRSSLASIFVCDAQNVSIARNNLFYDNNLYFNNAGQIFGIDARNSIIVHDTSQVNVIQNWVIIGKYTKSMISVTDSDNFTNPKNKNI